MGNFRRKNGQFQSGKNSVTANHTIDAFFAINQYDITASADTAHGSIAPQGDNTVNYNDSIRFSITPHTGYHVSGVYIDNADTSIGAVSSYAFRNVTADHMISAFFDIDQYSLTFDTVPTNGGGVTKYPDHTEYDSNTVVQLTAAPNTGYHFVNWSGDASGSTNPTSVTMNADKNITANFAVNTYAITPTAGTNGGISPSSDVVVNYGDSAHFTITPNSCYHVDSVIVDGAKSDSTTSYTFRNVIVGHTIRAVFRTNVDTITTSVGSNGGISPSGAVLVNCGSSQRFTFMPGTGYHVDSVIVDGLKTDSTTRYTFTNVTTNHTIRGVFAINRYPLTVNSNPSAGGTTTPSGGQYDSNTVVQLRATPNSGYRFDHWSGDASGPADTTSVTMNAAKTVTANFVRTLQVIIGTNPVGRSFTVDSSPYTSTQTFTWDSAASHTIATTSPQSGGTGKQFVWTSWTDGGARSHTITPASTGSYTANFKTQFLLTSGWTPQGGGQTSPTSAGWQDSSTVMQDTATPNLNYRFGHWSGDISTSDSFANPLNVTMSKAKTITANFVSTVQVTVATNPPGLTDTVDGVGNPPSNLFTWDAGSSHVIATNGTQAGGTGKQFVWTSWTDGGARSHTITPASTGTYTANFKTQFLLTPGWTPQAGGQTSLTSVVWKDSNTVIQDTATANLNYRFGHWSGDIAPSDSFSNPLSITVNRAKSVTANFVATVQDTVGTHPPGLSFSVDGNSPPSTQVYTWDLGSVHTLGTTRTQPGGTGRQFDWTGWSDAGDSTHSITAGTSRSYTATFKTQFQFTSASSPDTTKGITSAQGTTWVDSAYAVSDTAKSKACNHFANWTGDTVSSANPITITLYRSEHVTANFAVNIDTIIASAGWGGTISPSGVVQLNCGSSQTFTVTPNGCYRIDSIIVDGTKKDSTTSYTFTNVTSNHSIRAVFAVKKDTIMASVDVENPWGTISPSGTVVDTCGANQTFTITPNACYGVSQVLVDGVNMGSITTYTFTNINSNHTIVASFSRLSYWINAGAGSGGTISPSGKFGVYCGANQTFTIAPNTGFNISNVVVDGVSQGAISTYTFYNVTSNHTISATFICIGYTITASAGAGGTISPSGNAHVCTGANQTFTITANSGYTINNVVVDGISKGAISTYTFQNVTSNHTISAGFSGGGSCQPPCCIDNDASYDKLTVTDAKGAQKTLLVRNALRPFAAGITDNSIASQLSLGTLNASFQSGQTVQSVSPGQGSTTFSIVVSGATYPLTLKLTTNAENNIQYWLVRSGQSNLQLTNSSSAQIGSSTNGIINIQPLATQPCQ